MASVDVYTTPRAYTLRLKGVASGNESWRDALWRTHEAVNVGAQVFGDWLLTLRGGLNHRLAEHPISLKSGKTRPPSVDERRQRHVLLALSWLSVESRNGAPVQYVLPPGEQKSALRGILDRRGLPAAEIDVWLAECAPVLEAHHRDDAEWVDRSAAFDAAAAKVGATLTRDECWNLLGRFFGKDAVLDSAVAQYLAVNQSVGEDDEEDATTDKVLNLIQPAGQWLSQRFGSAAGNDNEQLASLWQIIEKWTEEFDAGQTWEATLAALDKALGGTGRSAAVAARLGGTGRPNRGVLFLRTRAKETAVTREDLDELRARATEQTGRSQAKVGAKGPRPYADLILTAVQQATGIPYRLPKGSNHKLYSVMLDHAARHVVQQWSWVKQAEGRRQSAREAQRALQEVPHAAVVWLDDYCERRGGESGALDGYRIRRAAIDGWEEVVRRWHACANEAERIHEARELQDELEKFGDIQLFEALAADAAKVVWSGDDHDEPAWLRTYVRARQGQLDERRFKVPALRHPDPLLHPVYCDFGYSRPDIEYAIHRRAAGAAVRDVQLQLWDGKQVSDHTLRWESKRLWADLGKGVGDDATPVSRVTRLGRAASGSAGVARPAALFEAKYWNGRLQAPRTALERLARLAKQGKTPAAESLRRRIPWSLTFSAQLAAVGPGIDYTQANGLRLFEPSPRNDHRWVLAREEDRGRKGQARLLFSRLPGLRLLSVDLGHRYAAACAVWETFTSAELGSACQAAGAVPAQPHELFKHLPQSTGRGQVIYRRLGSDQLPDGSPHPAPWARLDRQFLIKLQGEEREPRRVTTEELTRIAMLARGLGHRVGTNEEAYRDWRRERALRVDDAMSDAVRLVRLGLRRHGDRARIVFALGGDHMPKTGGQALYWELGKDRWAEDVAARRQARQVFIRQALVRWHELASGAAQSRAAGRPAVWVDEQAEKLWLALQQRAGAPALQPGDDEERGRERKTRLERIETSLAGVAARLVDEPVLCNELAAAWRMRWSDDDGHAAGPGRPASGWYATLRWLRDWVLPSGPSVQHNVGGLGLERIAAIQSLYRLQRAFKGRPLPDDLRANVPSHDEDGAFGARLLETLEELRLNRVKQLSSRIVEAALGLGRLARPQNGSRRPIQAPDAACHAVVIENLKRYRPEQTRTRRENRQLMSWSSAQVRKYLIEGCELHGLWLDEIWPGYTSRQDSRTASPGVRCADVAVHDFVRPSSPYWKRADNLGDTAKEPGQAAEKRYLRALQARWDQTARTWTDRVEIWRLGQDGHTWTPPAGTQGAAPRAVRLPTRGGEIFVSAHRDSPASYGLQADLNAAANIGLRALTDPDWEGRWWWVMATTSGLVNRERVTGTPAGLVPTTLPLDDPPDPAPGKPSRRRAKREEQEFRSYWRDPSTRRLAEGRWRVGKHYWNIQEAAVVRTLARQAGVQLDA